MKIKYFCVWWGLDHLGMEGMIEKIAAGGFDGLETYIPRDPKERDQLRRLLDQHQLDVIAHQFQAAGDTFEAWSASYRDWLEVAASFGPLLINSHTGKDHWTMERNGRLVEIAQEVSEKYNLPIVHETHRGRFLYSTSAARDYFAHYPNLRINADFSHWTCVSESLLEDQPLIMADAIARAEHIHARVGHAQGPQIPDPKAPEWSKEVETFVGWWKRIRDRFIADGREYMTITPEFGPPPYMWTQPFTQQPVNEQWEVNRYMKKLLEEKLSRESEVKSQE